MEKNVAGQKWTVFAFNRTNNQPAIGEAANITGKIRQDFSAAAAITDTNPTEIEDGFYDFDLTQAETNGKILHILPECSTADIQVVGVPGTIETDAVNASDLSVNGSGLVTLADASLTAAKFGAGAIDAASMATPVKALLYNGIRGIGVYVDTTGSNTNTVVGIDGTPDNPVSDMSSAKTLANALGSQRLYLVGNSVLSLTASIVNFEVIGSGEHSNCTVQLASQDVNDTLFINLTLEGIQGGTGRCGAFNCCLQDPGAGTTDLHIMAWHCGIVDQIRVDASDDNVFTNCYDASAGSWGNPAQIVATGAAGTIKINNFQGDLELLSLSAAHVVNITMRGKLTFNSSCDVNATVLVAGDFTIVDGTAGMVNLTQDAVINMPKINTEADTAITDAALSTAAALATVDGNVDTLLTRATEARLAELDGANVPADVDTLLTRATEARLAELDAANIPADADTIKAAATEARLAELDGANVPADVDAIKAITDVLSTSTIEGAVAYNTSTNALEVVAGLYKDGAIVNGATCTMDVYDFDGGTAIIANANWDIAPTEEATLNTWSAKKNDASGDLAAGKAYFVRVTIDSTTRDFFFATTN